MRTLQRWHWTFKTCGKDGLEPSAPRKSGRRSPPELINLVEGLALLKPRRTTVAIHRQANAVAVQRGWAPLSYSTIRSITTGLDPGMLTMVHQGSVAYRDRYELVWRRRAERPNVVWQTDHTELDILVLDAEQHTVRPWLTTILDDYSRAICGYMLFRSLIAGVAQHFEEDPLGFPSPGLSGLPVVPSPAARLFPPQKQAKNSFMAFATEILHELLPPAKIQIQPTGHQTQYVQLVTQRIPKPK